MKYSVTTVCLPALDMTQQAALLQKLGFDGVELRVRRVSDELRAKAEPSNWGYHVNDVTPENFAEKAPEIRRILSDHGLALAGLATNMTCLDLEQFKHALEGAVVAGAPFIRLAAAAGYTGKDNENYWSIYGETVAGYARCVELAKGSGVKLLLEMHGGTIHPSASLAYRVLSQFSPSSVGVIYDPQNMVKDGFETPALALSLLGDYLAHCHFGAHRPLPGDKDAKGTVQWKWEACSMAEGLFNFPLIIKLLQKQRYSRFITIEDFRAIAPEQKLAEGIQYLRALEEQA
ncbi:MAG: sugar phosphate isomerase/epimerase family protein [Lentisphaeria bacterium]|jgi:sugar phosphate isomerase/epimerase